MAALKDGKKLTRRNFLKRTTAGIFGSGVLVNAGKYFQVKGGKSPAKDVEMKYRTLGRSGLKVSEIGMGTWEAPNENVMSYAIDKGINYIDTAPEYKEGEEERMVGRVVKNRRDKVVIASKFFTTSKSTKQETMNFLEATLKRMQTDYLDVMIIYQVGEILPRRGITKGIERLKNENVIEMVNQAKKDGKVRAFGVSSHGGDLAGYMNYAVDSGNFDMIMIKYNFMTFPEEEKITKKAKENNVGSVAFKVVGGAYDQKIKGYENSRTPEFRRAAIKWVLSNPNITTLVIRMPTFDEVDNCLKSLSEKMGYNDRKILERYASAVKPYFCRWCGTCTQACPYSVAVPTIQRYLMYYTNFNHQGTAVQKYANLLPEQRAYKCFECSAPCEKICPNNIPIKEILTQAHKTLKSDIT